MPRALEFDVVRFGDLKPLGKRHVGRLLTDAVFPAALAPSDSALVLRAGTKPIGIFEGVETGLLRISVPKSPEAAAFLAAYGRSAAHELLTHSIALERKAGHVTHVSPLTADGARFMNRFFASAPNVSGLNATCKDREGAVRSWTPQAPLRANEVVEWSFPARVSPHFKPKLPLTTRARP